jgi:hypothetical protein
MEFREVTEFTEEAMADTELYGSFTEVDISFTEGDISFTEGDRAVTEGVMGDMVDGAVTEGAMVVMEEAGDIGVELDVACRR